MNDLSQIVHILVPIGESYNSFTDVQRKTAQKILAEYAKEILMESGFELTKPPRCTLYGYTYSSTDRRLSLRIDIKTQIKVEHRGWRNGDLRISPRLEFIHKENRWKSEVKPESTIYFWPSDSAAGKKIVRVAEGITDAIYREFGIYSIG